MDSKDTVSGILRSADLQPGLAAELEKLRRNITVLFTDIKGSTAYFERFGDSAGLLMLHHCNGLLSKIVERYGGRVIKTIGDSVMAAFEDNAEAVASAIEMQRALAEENASKPEEQQTLVRIGLNYGPGFVKSNDVFGDVVNTASRVETVAAPGQIVVSDALHETLAASARFKFRHLGRFALKGKAETRDLFEVVRSEHSGPQLTAAHSLIALESGVAGLARFALQQIRKDGSKGKEYALQRDEMLIGSSEGDLTFPHDAKMQARHARLSLDRGQLFVEPIADSVVFFSLVGPYRLRDGDVVRMGEQVFEFKADTEVLEAAAATGKKIQELARLMGKPAAAFVSTSAEKGYYPITDEQVTWGRTKATYVFPSDLLMSRSHAEVYHRGEDLFLEDSGSRNGTFVKVRERTPLPVGAILSLGGQLFRVARTSPD